MADLGFVRNEAARHLRSGRSRTLAYVMLDAANPFFTDVAAGIEEAAEESHFSLYMCNSGNRADREAAYLDHLRRAAGAGHPRHPDRPGGRAPRAPSRGAARRSSSSTAPPATTRSARSRSTTCSAARWRSSTCSTAATSASPSSAVPSRSARSATGSRAPPGPGGGRAPGHHRDRAPRRRRSARAGMAGERLLGLAGKKRPTAAFCANDLLALGLLQQVVASGLRVPDDLAIVGYDDIYFAGAAAVPLTSVRQPRHELGRRAAELVHRRGRQRRARPPAGRAAPRAGRPDLDPRLSKPLAAVRSGWAAAVSQTLKNVVRSWPLTCSARATKSSVVALPRRCSSTQVCSSVPEGLVADHGPQRLEGHRAALVDLAGEEVVGVGPADGQVPVRVAVRVGGEARPQLVLGRGSAVVLGVHPLHERREALVEPDVLPALDGDRVAEPLVRELVHEERGVAEGHEEPVHRPRLRLQREADVERGDHAAGLRERVVAEPRGEPRDQLRRHRHHLLRVALLLVGALLRDGVDPRDPVRR